MENHNKNIDKDELLLKKLSGEITEKEQAELDEWLNASEENRKFLEVYEGYWENKPKTSDKVKEDVWAKFEEKAGVTLEQSTENSDAEPKVKSISSSVVKWLSIAASVAIGALLLNFFVFNSTDDAALIVSKETAAGNQSVIAFSDGTKITLNNKSKISYPKEFSASMREVTLEGEAYFDVAKDETRPFIINTGDLQTIVHGTSFNVEAYNASEKVIVSVNSGKVELKDTKRADLKSLFLTKGQMGIYDGTDPALSLLNVKESAFAWKEGAIVFENASMKEIATILENWYDVQVIIKDDIDLGSGISGNYQNESLRNILEGISFSGNFKYTIEGKIVTVSK